MRVLSDLYPSDATVMAQDSRLLAVVSTGGAAAGSAPGTCAGRVMAADAVFGGAGVVALNGGAGVAAPGTAMVAGMFAGRTWAHHPAHPVATATTAAILAAGARCRADATRRRPGLPIAASGFAGSYHVRGRPGRGTAKSSWLLMATG